MVLDVIPISFILNNSVYGLDDPGSSLSRGKIFGSSPKRPFWLWGPTTLFNAYREFVPQE